VTDQIELPPVPQSPPIVTLMGYGEDAPSIITFNRRHNELLVNLEIRDEDRTETLKLRWKIVSGFRPLGAPFLGNRCPEPEIPGDGSKLLRTASFTVQNTSFAPGSCNRIDVIVSASFKTCRPDREDDWDVTTQEDDDADIGRLSFWVWAYDDASDPLVNPAASIPLLTSCERLEYQPPSATATSTSAAMTGM
jgi:hypothetical protein